MKPIVIPVKSIDNEDVIVISQKELQDMIDKVYAQGLADGQALEKPTISYPVPFPSYPLPYPGIPDTTTFPNPQWIVATSTKLLNRRQ